MVHNFICDFTTRYANQLSKDDFKYIYEFELSAFVNGQSIFYLNKPYKNRIGKIIIIKERYEDKLIVNYEGEDYEVVDFWMNYDEETIVFNDCLWFANHCDTIEPLTNER